MTEFNLYANRFLSQYNILLYENLSFWNLDMEIWANLHRI